MIFLNWYKRFVGKLFGSDEDTYDNNTRNDNERKKEGIETQFMEGERPTFRFPIISDAEIYGWDENKSEVERESLRDPESVPSEDEDLFEPTPLYENDRWPGDPAGGRIFRAGDDPKSKVGFNPQRASFLSDKNLKEPEPVLFKTTVIKSFQNRAFTPTTVPSPIYGFTKPEKVETTIVDEAVRVVEVEEKKLYQSLKMLQ